MLSPPPHCSTDASNVKLADAFEMLRHRKIPILTARPAQQEDWRFNQSLISRIPHWKMFRNSTVSAGYEAI